MMDSREAQIVLTASRISLEREEALKLRTLLQEPVDWAALLRVAIPHGVLPLFFRSLSAAAPDLAPADLLVQLRRHAERIQERNKRAAAELAVILEVLADRGIEAIPFKGLVLQQTVYKGLPVREFADLDLVVPKEQAIAAAEILEANGYRLCERQRKRGLRPLLRNGDEAEFNREGRMTVDLHWRFSNVGFDFPLDPNTLHSELEYLQIAGRSVRTYRPQITLLILCAHQANHRWRRLNWLCDVDALLENWSSSIEWPDVLKMAQELRCERILLTTLCLAESLLDTRLANPILSRLENCQSARELGDSLAPAILKGHKRRRWLYLQMREGSRAGVFGRYLVSKLRWHLAWAKIPPC